uniref:Diacylglycerol lipase-beta n=1 Tax=Mola mola TaxID=94237 RepID=A0A3Q3VU93_MOLML
MPGLVVFGRRWQIASDDFVFPGCFELFFRVLWWIGIMILFIYHKFKLDCNGRGVLYIYLVGLLVVLGLIILSLCVIVYVSAQGKLSTSKNFPGIRRFFPTLVYLRALLYIPELVWACLGAYWVSDDSQGCEPATVDAVIAAVVASWIILLFTGLGVLFVFDPMGSRFFPTPSSLAVKVWERRLRLLCCCLPQDESYRAVFLSIAQLFSRYFSDQELVPSDVAAGLSLLHRKQDKIDRSRDPEVIVDPSPSPPIGDDLEMQIEKAAHFMKFAAAAYGWPLYIYSNLFTAPCKICGACCGRPAADYDIVEGDHCSVSSILQSTGLQLSDLIHVSFHDQVYEIPFFVALDRQREAVLVAVRGTLSLQDVLTDLSAQCENLTIEGVIGSCYAHKGISQAADYIYKKLVNDGILNKAFSRAPEYKLVITGHSLGAGAAGILAVLLRNSYPTLQCYSFSPPGGLLSKALADYSKDFVVSVVLGKDLVPRLSMPNMEKLKKNIAEMVKNCSNPKYRILLQGCWYELFGGDPGDFPTEMDNRREEQLGQPLLGEESLMIRNPSSYQSMGSNDSPASSAPYLPLFLPGRVVYITEDRPSRRSCLSQVQYCAKWSDETEFGCILISPRMLVDHMPDGVLGALNSLTNNGP